MARREIIECDWCGEEIASEDNVIRVDDNDVCSWECVVRLAIKQGAPFIAITERNVFSVRAPASVLWGTDEK